MGLIRLILFGFLGLSVVYVMLSIYSRSIRREKLENQWAEEHPDGGNSEARQTYIDNGVAEYNHSLRPKLLLLVFVVPAVLVATIHILTTYY